MTSSEVGNHRTHSGKSFEEVDHFVNADGNYLYCVYWKPESPPKFLVCMVHGLGGHCARFQDLALHLSSLGGFVFSHDHVGHGESEGERMMIGDYQVFIRDVFQHIDKMKEKHPDLPLFLYGQSMGGALSVLAASQKPDMFQGVITLGAMLKTDPQMSSAVAKFFVKVAASLLPRMKLSVLDERQSTRDTDQIENARSDKLLGVDVKSQMAFQVLRITEAVTATGGSFSTPFLAVHGGADEVCDPEGSKWLHQIAKSQDKTVKIYDGCLHDVIHEVEEHRLQCINDIGMWVKERVSTT